MRVADLRQNYQARASSFNITWSEEWLPVRSTISAGTLAVSWMSFCNSSPEAGWNSCWALSISARNSGSLTMASNAVRNTFTRSAGMPGGATIERPTAALLV